MLIEMPYVDWKVLIEKNVPKGYHSFGVLGGKKTAISWTKEKNAKIGKKTYIYRKLAAHDTYGLYEKNR